VLCSGVVWAAGLRCDSAIAVTTSLPDVITTRSDGSYTVVTTVVRTTGDDTCVAVEYTSSCTLNSVSPRTTTDVTTRNYTSSGGACSSGI
jgi:hypothetical protein